MNLQYSIYSISSRDAQFNTIMKQHEKILQFDLQVDIQYAK